jgi:hypothetical protein
MLTGVANSSWHKRRHRKIPEIRMALKHSKEKFWHWKNAGKNKNSNCTIYIELKKSKKILISLQRKAVAKQRQEQFQTIMDLHEYMVQFEFLFLPAFFQCQNFSLLCLSAILISGILRCLLLCQGFTLRLQFFIAHWWDKQTYAKDVAVELDEYKCKLSNLSCENAADIIQEICTIIHQCAMKNCRRKVKPWHKRRHRKTPEIRMALKRCT